MMSHFIDDSLYILGKIITPLVITLALSFVIPSYLGLWLVAVSVWSIAVAISFPTILFGTVAVFLGLTFDYYLRWGEGFTIFYQGGGSSFVELCALTVMVTLWIAACDGGSPQVPKSRFGLPRLGFRFNRFLGWLSIGLVFFAILYLLLIADKFYNRSFDVNEIGRHAVLEYTAILLLIAIVSRKRRDTVWHVFVIVGMCYAILLVVASYRMASTIALLTLFLCVFEGKSIKKMDFILGALFTFLLMSAIGLMRSGSAGFDLANILGYKFLPVYGFVLDNTFTGVIETSLIYSAYAEQFSFADKLKYWLAIIIPAPSSILPPDFNYHAAAKLYHSTRVPGGGITAGYVIFTGYLLAPVLLAYLQLALFRTPQVLSERSLIKSILFVVVLITLMRWSLYGAYALFKFAGIFLLLCGVNRLLDSVQQRR